MRIVVVGTIVADTIVHTDGSVTESLGGIAHTVAALAALGDGRHTIVPLCRVGDDCRARVVAWAAPLPGVTLEAVRYTEWPNPSVRLSYADGDGEGERVERLSDAHEPLSVDEVGATATADAVIVNCITGADCTISAMHEIGSRCRRLYLDVHSLALGAGDDGRRYYRGREDWAAWLGQADVVQSNLREAATICGLEPGRVGDEEVVAGVAGWMRGEESAAGMRAPGVWLVTLGAAGAVVLRRRAAASGPVRVAAPSVRIVDPTGAGDAFGAGYVCAWLDGKAALAATQHAVRTGSAACAIAGVPSAAALRRALRQLPPG